MGLDMYLYTMKKEEITFKEVAYWRKANQIHKWFVDNIQNGVDDCDNYQVSKENLEELLNICKQVKSEFNRAVKTEGKVKNGRRLVNGEWEDMFKDGVVYVDLNTAAINELLPTDKGFFFGSTDIDQWYLSDIEDTISQLERVINEVDFENNYVCYSSSW